ncbi:MAG TPA: GWxTD domain-containing protein [Bacteroidia bacterium]|nr:GWxTD domain-containing protein [Bacteroidia bacterium]
MKRIQIILLISLMCCSLQSQAKNLQALFSYKTFYSPESGPYIETYLSVNARSVVYSKNASGKFQGSIEISVVYKNAAGTSHTDKYNLLSPEVADTSNIKFSFLDQQRVQLPNGKYVLEMTITDKNVPEKPYKVNQPIDIEYFNNIAAVSDIQFLDSYTKAENSGVLTKSGYDLVPYVDNFFPSPIKTLKFYAEIYNTDKIVGTAPYLVFYYIESAESKKVVENLQGFSKQNPEKVNAILREIPLGDLPSGNYNLVVEIKNQQNEVMAVKSSYFQRSNIIEMPADADFKDRDVTNTFASFITNKDTLVEYINCLHPIAYPLEITFLNNQMKLADVKMMQRFFYDFWVKRSPVNPEKAWMDYYTEVLKVKREYSTRIMPGYATERGRIYLKYGAPNTINKNYTEPSAYPYEIWHYYKLGNQSNRKFVFYNPDLVTNDFTLLHSDAQGEINNPQWQMVLHKRDTQTNDFDKENKGSDYFGNNADDNFKNPK